MYDEFKIKAEVSRITDEIISLRRYFHMHPELGFNEYGTSQKIQEVLAQAGIPYEVKAKTGVVAEIRGSGGGMTGLRCDMDALPVTERTGLPFASVNSGIMHACGHDGHMAVGLGVARVLKKFEKKLEKSVRFIFQPCEESPPGGALAMIEEGVIAGLDFLLGFHFFPMLPLYKIWIGSGSVMANTDSFSIRLKGRGGHGASPHLAKDPIACSAVLVSAINTIVSRSLDPMKPAVVSVCEISGGSAFNIIPGEVLLRGTVRTLDDVTRHTIKSEIEKKAEAVAAAYGCSAEISYDLYCPSCVNDEKLAGMLKQAAEKILPAGSLVEYHPVMGGEDFAFFSRKIPSCYIFIGVGKECGDNHNDNFSIDEKILPYTVSMLAGLILREIIK